MEVAYTIGGGGLHLKNYIMDDGDIATGIPVLADGDTANTNGVIPGTATSAINMLGISVDTDRSGSTLAQVAVGAGDRSNGNNASFVKVCINPDAVYRAKLANTTSDTALDIITQVALDQTGLAPTTIQDLSLVWGYAGANRGHYRYADAANSVELAFQHDIAAGDQWLEAFAMYISSKTLAPTLTTDFTQIASQTAASEVDNFVVVEFELKDITDDGANNSFALIMAQDHAFGSVGIVA